MPIYAVFVSMNFGGFNEINTCKELFSVFHTSFSYASYLLLYYYYYTPSVLWRCWLGARKGIRPVKNWVVGAGMVICLERDADLHMAQLMPLSLTVSCFSKIQIGFTFLVPAQPGSPGQRAVKTGVCVWLLLLHPFNGLFSRTTEESH